MANSLLVRRLGWGFAPVGMVALTWILTSTAGRAQIGQSLVRQEERLGHACRYLAHWTSEWTTGCSIKTRSLWPLVVQSRLDRPAAAGRRETRVARHLWLIGFRVDVGRSVQGEILSPMVVQPRD